MKRMKLGLFLALTTALVSASAKAQVNAVLPSAMSQFVDGAGAPYAGGRVYFYVPGTTTPANTWQDPYQLTLNSNPVVLDGNGRAIIWGNGTYREVLQDQAGNTIWDQLTTSAQVPTGTGTGVYVFQTGPTIASANLTGVPIAPTAAPGTNTLQLANTAFVTAAIAAIVPPMNAVPSKAIMAFDLAACPAGWVTANGTGGTPDMRGVVARGQDLGRGLDTSGTALGGYEADQFQTHTHAAAAGSFMITPGVVAAGTSGAVSTWGSTPNTGSANSGSYGGETRAKATVLLYCMKS